MSADLGHRGIVWITHEDLRQLLYLPENQWVATVAADWQRMAVGVVVAGPGLPECAPGAEPMTVDTDPYVDLQLRAKVQALVNRYVTQRDGPDSDDVLELLGKVLAREFNPLVDMPEELRTDR